MPLPATVTTDPDVRAVVIFGGEKVFAAGADVKEFAGQVGRHAPRPRPHLDQLIARPRSPSR